MALVCELCDSTDFVKEEGMFVCRSCGTKYTLEEAKKLMNGAVAATSSTPAASAAATAEKISNMLTLAENAFEQANNTQAEEYANKVLEIDSTNALAWLIKGEAVGWQSKLNNVRFSEMASCFKYALNYAAEEDKETYKKIMADQGGRLSKAFVNLTCGNFSKYPSKDNAKDIRESIAAMMSLQLELLKMMIFMDTKDVYDSCSLKLNEAAVQGSDKADNDFGPDNSDKTKYAWDLYRERCDTCLEVLDHALSLCESESRVNTINNNYRIIMNNITSSCSYKFEATGYWSGYVKDYSLTSEAVNIRNRKIREFDAKAKKKLSELQEKRRKKEREEREAKEKAQREKNEKYWSAHAEEKAALDNEKAQLNEKVTQLENQIKEEDRKTAPEIEKLNKQKGEKLPSELAVEEQQALIKALGDQRDSLGLFKGKEKKAINARLDETEYPKLSKLKEDAAKERKELELKINKQIQELTKGLTELRGKVSKHKERIKEIDKELTKPR